MPTWSLNSKKCLTASFLFAAIAAWSGFIPAALASIPKNLPLKLESEVKNRNKLTFAALLRHWEDDYGVGSVAPLLAIAKNKSHEDADRYVALMGAAKIGGVQNAPALLPFLKDSSWMLRSGALNALARLRNPKTAAAVLPLLKDKALVVRLEAVEAARVLRPPGVEKALIKASLAPENYHHGKAQWIPEHALSALVALQAKDHAKELSPLLDKKSDPGIQRRTLETLRALRGPSGVRKDLSLQAQCTEWKKILARK